MHNASSFELLIVVLFDLIALLNQNKDDPEESEQGKFHSVWIQKIWNSCISVVPNTYAWNSKNEIRQKDKRMQAEKSEYGKKESGHERKVLTA